MKRTLVPLLAIFLMLGSCAGLHDRNVTKKIISSNAKPLNKSKGENYFFKKGLLKKLATLGFGYTMLNNLQFVNAQDPTIIEYRSITQGNDLTVLKKNQVDQILNTSPVSPAYIAAIEETGNTQIGGADVIIKGTGVGPDIDSPLTPTPGSLVYGTERDDFPCAVHHRNGTLGFSIANTISPNGDSDVGIIGYNYGSTDIVCSILLSTSDHDTCESAAYDDVREILYVTGRKKGKAAYMLAVDISDQNPCGIIYDKTIQVNHAKDTYGAAVTTLSNGNAVYGIVDYESNEYEKHVFNVNQAGIIEDQARYRHNSNEPYYDNYKLNDMTSMVSIWDDNEYVCLIETAYNFGFLSCLNASNLSIEAFGKRIYDDLTGQQPAPLRVMSIQPDLIDGLLVVGGSYSDGGGKAGTFIGPGAGLLSGNILGATRLNDIAQKVAHVVQGFPPAVIVSTYAPEHGMQGVRSYPTVSLTAATLANRFCWPFIGSGNLNCVDYSNMHQISDPIFSEVFGLDFDVDNWSDVRLEFRNVSAVDICSPTVSPSPKPTPHPTDKPTYYHHPTYKPTYKHYTHSPTNHPSTECPTLKPTYEPTYTTKKPTHHHYYPTHPTYYWEKTPKPTKKPTYKPTHKPTHKPTYKPTHKPTYKPTEKPTKPTYYWEKTTKIPTKYHHPSYSPTDCPSPTINSVPSQDDQSSSDSDSSDNSYSSSDSSNNGHSPESSSDISQQLDSSSSGMSWDSSGNTDSSDSYSDESARLSASYSSSSDSSHKPFNEHAADFFGYDKGSDGEYSQSQLDYAEGWAIACIAILGVIVLCTLGWILYCYCRYHNSMGKKNYGRIDEVSDPAQTPVKPNLSQTEAMINETMTNSELPNI